MSFVDDPSGLGFVREALRQMDLSTELLHLSIQKEVPVGSFVRYKASKGFGDGTVLSIDQDWLRIKTDSKYNTGVHRVNIRRLLFVKINSL